MDHQQANELYSQIQDHEQLTKQEKLIFSESLDPKMMSAEVGHTLSQTILQEPRMLTMYTKIEQHKELIQSLPLTSDWVQQLVTKVFDGVRISEDIGKLLFVLQRENLYTWVNDCTAGRWLLEALQTSFSLDTQKSAPSEEKLILPCSTQDFEQTVRNITLACELYESGDHEQAATVLEQAMGVGTDIFEIIGTYLFDYDFTHSKFFDDITMISKSRLGKVLNNIIKNTSWSIQWVNYRQQLIRSVATWNPIQIVKKIWSMAWEFGASCVFIVWVIPDFMQWTEEVKAWNYGTGAICYGCGATWLACDLMSLFPAAAWPWQAAKLWVKLWMKSALKLVRNGWSLADFTKIASGIFDEAATGIKKTWSMFSKEMTRIKSDPTYAREVMQGVGKWILEKVNDAVPMLDKIQSGIWSWPEPFRYLCNILLDMIKPVVSSGAKILSELFGVMTFSDIRKSWAELVKGMTTSE